MAQPEKRGFGQFPFTRSGLVLAGFFLGVAGYFLRTEHQAHLIAVLPWILVGGRLVMHLFVHGAQGGHGRPP